MSTQSMPVWDETKNYYGRWWPSPKRDVSFKGFLAFEERRPRLTVVSLPIGQRVFDLADPRVVHGELDSGEQVTLWDTAGYAFESMENEAGAMKHARRFTHAVLGEHLDSYEEARFRFSSYRLHGLGTWSAMDTPIPEGLSHADLPQYEPAHLVSEREDAGVEYSAEFRIENPRRLETSPNFPSGAISNYTGKDARVVIECHPPAPALIHDLLLFDLQALLTFSYQGGAPLESEWLATQDMEKALNVLRMDPFTGHKPTGHVFRQTMILTTEAAEPAELFPAWWKAVDELYPATQVITSYHHGSRGVLESSVSSAIAVAEHLHGIIGPTRTRFPDGFLADKEKPLRTAMKQAFPNKADAPFRNFIYEALRNDRPTLDTRLEELAAAVTDELMALMTINKEQWIADVKSVRNRIAHTSSHVRRRGGDGSALHRVNRQTRAIVTLLILKQMGLDKEALERGALALSAELKHFAIDEAQA